MNNVVLMGRLVADPELKNTTSGLEVCSFCIAVNRPYAKDDDQKADFINIVTWRKTAVFVSTYFKKGQMIALQGSMQVRKYTDKDGNNRYATEVVANSVNFCGSKNENTSNTAANSNDIPFDDNPSTEEDDLPF